MKDKRPLAALILIGYLAVIIFTPASIVNSPKFFILSVIRFPVHAADRFLYNLHSILRSGRLVAENKALQNTVDMLTSQLARYKDMESENIRLKELFEFKQKSPFKLLAAKVIGRDSTNLSSTIIIDKGKKSGVKKDSVIMTQAGLAGRVIEVSASMSRAMLITDPDSRVSAIVVRSRQTGMMFGLGVRVCKLRYLMPDSDIKIGDEVATSGFSAIYPKDILIGKVVRIEKDASGFGLCAIIEPASDFSRLEEILCIIG